MLKCRTFSSNGSAVMPGTGSALSRCVSFMIRRGKELAMLFIFGVTWVCVVDGRVIDLKMIKCTPLIYVFYCKKIYLILELERIRKII